MFTSFQLRRMLYVLCCLQMSTTRVRPNVLAYLVYVLKTFPYLDLQALVFLLSICRLLLVDINSLPSSSRYKEVRRARLVSPILQRRRYRGQLGRCSIMLLASSFFSSSFQSSSVPTLKVVLRLRKKSCLIVFFRVLQLPRYVQLGQRNLKSSGIAVLQIDLARLQSS